MKVIILFSMFFLHIVDDYYLQGILAKFKQKSWWKENAPNELYKHDFVIALMEHAFSWSFMVHIPIMIYTLYFNLSSTFLCVSILLNLVIHAAIDHIKANKLKINLTTDQMLHFIQIIVTFFVYFSL